MLQKHGLNTLKKKEMVANIKALKKDFRILMQMLYMPKELRLDVMV